ncbi:chemotaxis protein CheB [Nitrincola sp. MINF-07-Sa-05]|uniref:chemotaxis protein CheB n=1 Tax=Nitrincola salilacus TaxID=3400273 RepID=UPI003918297E
MVRVVMVEDSPVMRQLLHYILDSGGIQIVGEAVDGEEAIPLVTRLRPDLVLMDINMPRLNGYQTTRRLMSESPVPIVLVTASLDPRDAVVAMQGLEAGAVAVVQKPRGLQHAEFEQDAAELLRVVSNMAQVKVVRRIYRDPAASRMEVVNGREKRLVVIGSSTGGPAALHEMLKELRPDPPWPLLLVQHITRGFLPSFCDWLSEFCPIPVTIAVQNELVCSGRLYLAPDDCHLGVQTDRASGGFRIQLDSSEPWQGQRPAVGHLFASAAEVAAGSCIAILLSGMGKDGVAQMLQLRQQGALTLAQDQASSVVHGMPGEALKCGAAKHALSPREIAWVLNELGARQNVAVSQLDDGLKGQPR